MTKKFFSLRWILTTLIAILAVGVLIRLGLWQLDRLEWRRAFNSRVTAQINAEPLDLTDSQPVDSLFDMEYRTVTVSGEFEFSQEVLLRNQVWENRLGFHSLTPMKISNSNWVVLVDRGWIPFENAAPQMRKQYQEPGVVTIQGIIRRAQETPDFGGVPDPTLSPGETRLDAWNVVNVLRIKEQSGLNLLPIYIIQAPEPDLTSLPYRSLPEIEISEGPHMGYAIQWFTFAAILGLGYPFFVRRQLQKDPTNSTNEIQSLAGIPGGSAHE